MIAVLTKPQAVVLAPVLLIVSWRLGGVRAILRGWGMAGLAATAVLLPLALVGQLPALWAQIQASAGKQLFLTMNAHNLWFLLTLGRGSFAARDGLPIYDTQPLVGLLTGWQLGLLLFGCWTIIVCWRLYRQTTPQPEQIFLAAVAMAVGFFLLPAEAHERYLFPALALCRPQPNAHFEPVVGRSGVAVARFRRTVGVGGAGGGREYINRPRRPVCHAHLEE
jgi:Gpi18-like mannosyltransferase